jgi:hypothetical protein
VLLYAGMTVLEQKHITGKAPNPILQDLATKNYNSATAIVKTSKPIRLKEI